MAAAAFLVVIALSTVVLYNTVEAFRVVVSDYAIELFDVGEGSLVSVESNENKNGETLVVPTWLPDGYEIAREMNQADVKMLRYSNGQSNITFTAHSDLSAGSATVDTENAIETYNIRIAEYNAVVVKRTQDVSLYWFESDTSYYIRADSNELESIIRMAESCYK